MDVDYVETTPRDSSEKGWLERHLHTLGWVSVGALIGAMIGWLVGSYTACSMSDSGCEVRIQAVEAAGTWFGGVGTILAVGAAVVAYRSDERSRRRQEHRLMLSRQQQMRLAEDEAAEVHGRWGVRSTSGRAITGLFHNVHNGANETPIYKVRVTSEAFGPFVRVPRVEPAKGATKELRFGSGSKLNPIKHEDHDSFLKELDRGTVIEYTMNGERWRRVGGRPPERLDFD